MVAPDERSFVVFERGQVRDEIILANYREGLRSLVNPETDLPFTEDEIQVATQPGSRFYIEADAIDLLAQANQARALFFSDQIDPRRASTFILEGLHGRLWLGEMSKLPAVGASGNVRATGTPGTIFVGSQTIGDPIAVVGTDPNGLRFQVLVNDVLDANGNADLAMKGIDTGFVTNLNVGTIVTWSQNIPLGSDPTGTVLAQVGSPQTGFTGGFDVETDAEYAERIEDRIRNRPASGNDAHFDAWARQASSAVEQGFVYATALHNGSVVVSVTQKRNQNADPPDGPLARVPAVGTLTDVTNFIVPPNSSVVPERVFVLVPSPNITGQPADMIVRLAMNQGTGGGWADVEPFPDPPVPPDPSTTEQVQISAVTSQTDFDIATTIPLPGGVTSLTAPNAPQMMVWNDAISRFEKLDVLTVTDLGATINVVLNAPGPSKTLAVGDRVSPFTDRLDVVAEALESYFDSLGPGELVAGTDLRFPRANRFPTPAQKFPIRAGQAVVSVLIDALGGVAPDAELTFISRNEPDLPANVSDGPFMVTLGKVNAFPL